MDSPIAANVLGTVGVICWSVQLIPQIIINCRRHNMTGLQPSMMMLWAWAGVPLGVYNIMEDFNIALQIQPQILTLLSLVTWTQCCYYGKVTSSTNFPIDRLSFYGLMLLQQWSVPQCLAIAISIAAVMAGVQIGLIFALRTAKDFHLTWPNILMAVLSATLLAAGVLRHYWDIWIHRSVRGISFIFVGIDAAGDLFSLASVFFQPKLDVLGMVIYGLELILWLGVFAAGGYFNLMPWVRRRYGLSLDGLAVITPAMAPEETETSGNDVVLHNLPSSTSVFRTASCELPGTRPRLGFSSSGRGDGSEAVSYTTGG